LKPVCGGFKRQLKFIKFGHRAYIKMDNRGIYFSELSPSLLGPHGWE